jgi:hypothetical protein
MIFEFYLNRESLFGSPYSHPISPHWDLFVPEGEGSRNSPLGGEFELLVEIVNPALVCVLEFHEL